ncbi:NrdH-like glutaredoxin [Microbacterium phage ArMaWen]|uniref:NrdH-like glutaredoxin n=1 Tax=Microbacterium phage ArMaWen TaxID=2500786 RepID=A0A3Q9RAE4_9CAUD|nr:NrdH-like glutaredoxin [Microbacterium phage ArMaWen]
MNDPIILWSKPVCQQCYMVKRLLIKELDGREGVDREDTMALWNTLIREGKVVEYDITAPENADQLEYFKKLGYLSAPITEYHGSATPGFNVAELKDKANAWKTHNVV